MAWDLGVGMDTGLEVSKLLQLGELLPIRRFTLEAVWVKNIHSRCFAAFRMMPGKSLNCSNVVAFDRMSITLEHLFFFSLAPPPGVWNCHVEFLSFPVPYFSLLCIFVLHL